MVADINAGAAAGIAAEIGGIAQAVDVSDGASVAAMAEAALTAWGRVDILVNNAGHHSSARAHGGGERRGFRPRSRRER
jgi:NADP-dependent 3-hydroxy acid dehydrogenase YdfG